MAAVCTVDGTGANGNGNGNGGDIDHVDGVSVVGRLDEVAEHVRRGGYRIVAVTADSYWTPRRLQQLAWRLEGSGAEMVVAPTLMEVAGPRLHVSGVLGHAAAAGQRAGVHRHAPGDQGRLRPGRLVRC